MPPPERRASARRETVGRRKGVGRCASAALHTDTDCRQPRTGLRKVVGVPWIGAPRRGAARKNRRNRSPRGGHKDVVQRRAVSDDLSSPRRAVLSRGDGLPACRNCQIAATAPADLIRCLVAQVTAVEAFPLEAALWLWLKTRAKTFGRALLPGAVQLLLTGICVCGVGGGVPRVRRVETHHRCGIKAGESRS